jgi:hypothetical protein
LTSLRLTKECANLRLLSHGADVGSGSGPGVGLVELNGGCGAFTRHRKVKVDGLEPANCGHRTSRAYQSLIDVCRNTGWSPKRRSFMGA